MATWVRCTEYEEGVDPSFSAQMLVNLETVRYMVRGVESTAISFTASTGQDGLAVHETPEQLLGIAPK
ncbi:hypothetical protein [Rhizomicrobium electricum]|nr:hypothetical protein [Rhizomicrobium electricum]NIJ47316.1 hypothetical protein [Rhizomicrobium electricum]